MDYNLKEVSSIIVFIYLESVLVWLCSMMVHTEVVLAFD